jgi:hypothetical protein
MAARCWALSSDRLRIFTRSGRLAAEHRPAEGTHLERAAFARQGRSVALVSRSDAGTRSRLTLLPIRGGQISERLVLSGAGRFDGIAWSPRGDWLLVSWATADQWLFIRIQDGTGPPGKVVTASEVAGQFDPAATGVPASPVPGGWCCRR